MYRSTLVLGGGFGCCFGALLRTILGSDAQEGQDLLRLFMPLGMCGLFSGLIRLPLTAVIVVFEMTAQADASSALMVPMLVVSMVSYFVGGELEPFGLYDHIAVQDEEIFEEREREENLLKKEVMENLREDNARSRLTTIERNDLLSVEHDTEKK